MVEVTSRELLRRFGFAEDVLAEWSDNECDEQLEAIYMYPND